MLRIQLLFVLVFVAGWSLSRGDEGRRRDGSAVVGKLILEGDAFRFVTDGKNESVGELESLIRNPVTGAVRECPWLLRLVGGDSFPVWPLELNAKELRARTPWAEELRIPRSAIERLGQLPGRQVVAVSGETSSLVIPIPDISAGWLALKAPLLKTTGKSLSLELGFIKDGKPAPIKLELAGSDDRLNVVAAEPADVTGKINRDGQTHRLSVTFDGDSLRFVVDGYVLWARDRSPGLLREVRIVSGEAGEGMPRVEQLAIWRSVKPAKIPASANATRDRVLTLDSGEIYGALSKFDTAGPVMELRDKPVPLPWGRVGVCDFGNSPGEERPTIGEHAELTGRMAGQPESRLVGRVKSWGEKSIELEHARLGMLTLPAGWVTEIRPLFYGKRLPLMPNARHLGSREVAGFRVPGAEGEAVRQFIETEDALVGAEIVVEALAKHRPAVLRISLNGETLGKIRISRDEVATYRMKLPATNRKGRVEWEIRQEADPKPGEVEVRHVRLEISLPRGEKNFKPK